MQETTMQLFVKALYEGDYVVGSPDMSEIVAQGHMVETVEIAESCIEHGDLLSPVPAHSNADAVVLDWRIPVGMP